MIEERETLYGEIYVDGNITSAELILRGPKGDKGDKGEQGPKGDTGEKGEQGPKGDTGVYVGATEPTDNSVLVWFSPDDEDYIYSANGREF